MVRLWTAILLAGSVAAIASASVLETFTFSGDDSAPDYITPGSLEGIAEARFGNNGPSGDWEIGVGADTQQTGQFTSGQRVWDNGEAVPFALEWDGTTMTFTVGNDSVSYDGFDSEFTVDDLAIRVASNDGTYAGLTNLEVFGVPVHIDNIAPLAGSHRNYLVIVDIFYAPFTLTGDIEFAWTGGTAGSIPSAQFKLVDAVPEPASLSLLALAALGLLRRR